MKRKTIWVASMAVLLAVSGAGCRDRRLSPERSGQPDIIRLEQTDSGTAQPEYRWPAEFENQQAIWIQWPSTVYDTKSKPVTPAIVSIIKALDPYIQVSIITGSNDEIGRIKSLLMESGYKGKNTRFYVFGHSSIWARDVGPVFVKNQENKLGIVDFNFNNYSRDGSPEYIEAEGNVHRLIADALGIPLVKTRLISEGGAIESNGKGTMMTTESVALKRNPGMTKQQIEDEYKRVLGVRKVIWMKSGLAEDDRITGGHINEFCRFAGPGTILLAQVLPGDRDVSGLSKESYRRMEENYGVLANSTDQDGNPFKIIRVPIPPTLYGETDSAGNLPVRSYLNYAVTNGAVIMQTYWNPDRSDDLKAAENGVKDTLKSVFPGRDIIGVDAESVNLWGGGIHCVTQHMPAE